MSNLVIGIGPGLDGAVAFVIGGFARVECTPVVQAGKRRQYLVADMRRLLDVGIPGERRAVVEEQHAMPKQGVTSMFSIGLGFGLWQGILAGLGIPYEIVRPADWKRAMGLPPKADKGASVALAQRLFPDVTGLVGPRGGPRDGAAEALLIAEYGRRTVEAWKPKGEA